MTGYSQPFSGAGALLFGGAKGIGRAVAREWARRGARVAIADIDEAAAHDTAVAIVAEGGEALGLAVDVASDGSVAAAASAAERALGGIDIVLNNVGIVLNGNPEDIPFAEWQRVLDLNFFAALRGVQYFLPGMLARGSGHIVTTASFAGLYPYASSRMPYAASKAAVIAMAESLALYLEPRGIRVSCLIPGPVMTGISEGMKSWSEDCPLRGPGSTLELRLPEDVAVTFSDGMRDGKILIPSDPAVWDIVRRWAESPDDFIRAKIAEFAAGDDGRPFVSEALKARLAAMRGG